MHYAMSKRLVRREHHCQFPEVITWRREIHAIIATVYLTNAGLLLGGTIGLGG